MSGSGSGSGSGCCFFFFFFAIYLEIDFFWSKKHCYDVRGVSLKKLFLILVLSRFGLFCATFDFSNEILVSYAAVQSYLG